jgi:hemerythrin superfamily protein
MAPEADVISLLIEDHREVERMFVDLESGDGSPEQRRDLADRVIIELVRHSVAEEQYLYPVARETVARGDELAEREIGDHVAAEHVMKSLEGVDAGNPAFDHLVGQLIADIRAHVAEEERELFPLLREACTEEKLVDLGAKVRRAKRLGPTRPHPSTPDTPPFNRLLAPGAGLVDRLRDALSGRGH